MRRFFFVLLAWALALGSVSQLRASGDPASATEKEAISIRPQRLILGPLAYGEHHSTILVREVKIEGLPASASIQRINLSHAPGVEVLDHIQNPDGITLRLGINVTQFTEGEPYGIFIKRSIRFETTSLSQPQLLLTVVGWTTLNKTSRNFNDYLFAGNRRWQGVWGTPNIAGSLLAPFLLLVLGSAATLFPIQSCRRRWLKMAASFPLFALSGVLLALLAVTYSRGAWISFVVGALVLILFSARLRLYGLGSLFIFAFALFFLPSGLSRVDSFTRVQEDLSIAHRFDLWVGALQIMGDHPFGVGAEKFGPVFQENYQRVDHVALNSTAVSDYFTFGSERGVPFLSLILGILLCVLFLSLCAARARDNPWQLTLSAAFLAILVASAFSTLWFVSDYQRLFGFTLAGLLICLAIQARLNWKRKLARIFALEGVFVLGCALILELVALASLLLQPTRSSDTSMTDSDGNISLVHSIEPRWQRAKGIIVYFPGAGDSLSLLCHSTLRPLAALGWKVLTPNANYATNPNLPDLAVATYPHLSVFVAGQKEGGRQAWSTLAGLSKPVIRAGAGLDFLTQDLDPSQGGATLHAPFLVFHRLYDDEVSANPAIRASRHDAFSGLPLSIQLCNDETSAFSAGTALWVKALDHYFAAQVPR